MSYVKLAATIRFAFGTSDPATGAATDADSTPTVTVYEQGTALGYSPTVTNKATGLYEVAIVCSGANGFEVGKEYSVAVAATVDSITGRDGLGSFTISAVAPDDLATAAALADVDADLAVVDGNVDDIEAALAVVDGNVDDIEAALAVVDGNVDAIALAVTAINADTDNIQTRLPAALVSGRMDASVGAMAADVVTAAAVATGAIDADALAGDAVTEIQAGLATASALTTVANSLFDIAGLLHKNAMVDQVTRDGAALVSARLRVFADAAALQAATPEAGNGADSETSRYAITATVDGDGLMVTYQARKTL